MCNFLLFDIEENEGAQELADQGAGEEAQEQKLVNLVIVDLNKREIQLKVSMHFNSCFNQYFVPWY